MEEQKPTAPRPLNDIQRELVATSSYAGELSYMIAGYKQELQKTYAKMTELKAEIEYTEKNQEAK